MLKPYFRNRVTFGDVHQRDLMAVGDVILRDDLDITAFAIASYMVAGRYRLQDNSANVVGGVNDEYFFHRVPSQMPHQFFT